MTADRNTNDTFEEVVERRLARRAFLKGALAAAPLLAVTDGLFLTRGAEAAAVDGLAFTPVRLDNGDEILAAPGYTVQKFLRWGEPILNNAPRFDFFNQTAEAQEQQIGYNCDFLQYFSLPDHRSLSPTRGLLCINHEYTNPELMFPGFQAGTSTSPAVTNNRWVKTELAAHGVAIVEVALDRTTNQWQIVKGAYNRRITGTTEMAITGPAAGHALMKTTADPTGTRVRGTLNNCGGGITPWGTLLTAEENFNQYFAHRSSMPTGTARTIHERYGLTAGFSERGWEREELRFDLRVEPNEPFRFGWVVEIDPYDPTYVPRKRTALGRLKHEAATCTLTRDNRLAVYSGDDERFEHVYKFVSSDQVSQHRQRNGELLDRGTLYAARFNDDGTGQWLPLLPTGPLASWTMPEILINTRQAALLMGATRMDRPEDLQVNPVNGKLYCAMTNNTNRTASGANGVNAANPRAANRHGHVIEVTETGGDHASLTFRWEIFMLCGNPAVPADEPTYFAGFDKTRVSAISSPDNITFDQRGNLWIATDGQINTFNRNDGIFAVPVEGADRGFVRQFLSGVPGGECASLALTPDDTTLFVSIQHPAEGSTIDSPTHRWPDGNEPRPTVIAVTKAVGLADTRIGS